MLIFFNKNKIWFFLFFLIIFSGFLRFNNLHNLYIFAFDEEYQATYAMTLVNDFHPIWIGVSASFLDYYLGPYFTYFTAFWLFLSKGDPILTAYIGGFLGVITTLVIFYIGKRFFNLTTGIISSLLYAGLPLFVFYDQKYWNPMFVQLIVLSIFASLILIKKSPWWWLLFSASIGAIFQTDLAPLPLLFVGVWLFFKGKYFLNKKLFLSCILVFLFFYWPLIIFDYNHNWSNLTVLSRYKEQVAKSGAKFDPQGKVISIFDTLGRFWYLEPGKSNAHEINIFCNSQRTNPSSVLIGLSAALLLLFFYLCFKKKKREYTILACLLLTSIIFYVLYTGGAFEYYVHGFITLFVFIPGIIISLIKSKYKLIATLFIVYILILGFNTVINSSDKYSLHYKKALISSVMEIVKNDSFSIDKIGECYTYDGWRYLFKVYGKTPSQSFTDKNFAWLYPKEVITELAIYNVILSENILIDNPNLIDYKKITEGGFSAYIKKVN